MNTRSLTSLEGNRQRLDGGAMFGNAARGQWSRWYAPDGENRVALACRALLVREAGRNILLETGIGAFFEPRLRARYGVVEERHVLLDSLATAGLSHEAIHVVVLSHLHFDHAGGLLAPWAEGEPHRLLFPNATYVVGVRAWERALAPHPRDRASFIPELTGLLAASGRLEVVSGEGTETLGPGFRFRTSDGHTPGMLLTEIDMPAGPVVFAADLVPGTPWVHLPVTMGYDRFPERVIDEKQALFAEVLERGGRIFYTHDPEVALSGLARDERGRYIPADPLPRLDNLAR